MKKLLIILVIFLQLNITFWYELSEQKNNALIQAKSKLWLLKDKKDINWYYKLKKSIDKKIPVLSDSEKIFILEEIRNEIIYIIDSYKPENFDNLKFEENNINFEKEFFEKYGKEITTDLKVPEKCTIYYDEIDKLALKNDFPTSLIIATWWKESNCWLYNPANWWWPFQITSSYHNPWDITLDDFLVKVQSFIDFSKYKWNYFNTNTFINYKDRFWNENLTITYNNYTLRELQIHSILYNWVWKTTTLNWNSFANANLNSSVTSKSDWVVTRFLKILNWKINN